MPERLLQYLRIKFSFSFNGTVLFFVILTKRVGKKSNEFPIRKKIEDEKRERLKCYSCGNYNHLADNPSCPARSIVCRKRNRRGSVPDCVKM